jgi:uncharacterized protein (DUF302 family)
MLIVVFCLGFAVAALLLIFAMPKLMFVTRKSRFSFADTIEKLEEAIVDNRWGHRGTWLIHNDLRQKNIDFKPRIANVDLCKAPYAADILREEKNRFLSSLMPCSFSVWEDNKGQVYISSMNTGLMGRIFGGLVAKIMGRYVAAEEHSILNSVTNA